MKVSKLALAAALTLVAVPFLATQQADAQGKQKQEGPTLSREEGAAINPLLTAVRASNWEAATAALPAAQAGAQSPYARFVVGQLQLQLGRGTNNQDMQMRAVDAMIESGAAPATAMPTLLGGRATFAIRASDWATAERMLTRFIEIEPNNVERLYQLAEVKINLRKMDEALALYQRIIQVADSAGTQPSSEHLGRAIQLATQLNQAPLAATLTQRRLQAYPTAENIRDALIGIRRTAGTDSALALDVRRLMFVSGAFSRPDDYIEFALRLNTAGLPAEEKAVLEEGLRRNVIPATDAEVRNSITRANARIAEDRPTLAASRTQALAGTARQALRTGDAFYAYGQYPQAIELYRAALQKGGEDPNLLNLRLGAALVAAGQRAEAQAAFRAVGGSRAGLAQLWLLWLERGSQPAAQPAPAQPTQQQ